MEKLAHWVMLISGAAIGVLLPTLLCVWICSLWKVLKQSLLKSFLVVLAGFLIVAVFTAILYLNPDIPPMLHMTSFCIIFLAVFAVLWKVVLRISIAKAIVLAAAVLIVFMTITFLLPMNLNPYQPFVMLRNLIAYGLSRVF